MVLVKHICMNEKNFGGTVEQKKTDVRESRPLEEAPRFEGHAQLIGLRELFAKMSTEEKDN